MTLPGALPWFVAIFVEGEHICDGSIIHESFVVTSVQCALKIYQAETRLQIYFLVFIRTLCIKAVGILYRVSQLILKLCDYSKIVYDLHFIVCVLKICR